MATCKNILLVDDERDFLTAMERNFRKFSDSVNVLTAAGGQEALAVLSRETIDLIVVDYMMPEITGLDLLFRIRSQWPNIEIIIITGHCTDDLKAVAQKNGCRHIFEKPFPMAEVRNAIFDILKNKEKGFAGIVKSISLSDLIQMCCLDGAFKTIRIRRGPEEGYIHIKEGEVVDALCGSRKGEEAFFEIIGWPEGSFETLELSAGIKQTITNGWQYLLMEAARKIDEFEDEGEGEGPEEDGPDIISLEDEITAKEPIRLMIVDDSALMIRALTDIFSSTDEIFVAGSAPDGEQALKIMDELKPDIMTLDINMPVMTGGTALRHIMIKTPCPVVIISSIANKQSMEQILEFLRLGAVDFLDKPKNTELATRKEHYISTIRRAAGAVTVNFKRAKEARERFKVRTTAPLNGSCKGVVAINSGPGGHSEAIKLVTSLPVMESTCCILLQPMPEEMMEALSFHMDCRSHMEVVQLYDNAPLMPGRCYVGPIRHAWRLERRGPGEWIICDRSASNAENEDAFCGLLKSIADSYALRLLTVLLSGAVISDIRIVEETAEIGHRMISQEKNAMMVSDFLTSDISAFVDQLESEKLMRTITKFEYASINTEFR